MVRTDCLATSCSCSRARARVHLVLALSCSCPSAPVLVLVLSCSWSCARVHIVLALSLVCVCWHSIYVAAAAVTIMSSVSHHSISSQAIYFVVANESCLDHTIPQAIKLYFVAAHSSSTSTSNSGSAVTPPTARMRHMCSCPCSIFPPTISCDCYLHVMSLFFNLRHPRDFASPTSRRGILYRAVLFEGLLI